MSVARDRVLPNQPVQGGGYLRRSARKASALDGRLLSRPYAGLLLGSDRLSPVEAASTKA